MKILGFKPEPSGSELLSWTQACKTNDEEINSQFYILDY